MLLDCCCNSHCVLYKRAPKKLLHTLVRDKSKLSEILGPKAEKTFKVNAVQIKSDLLSVLCTYMGKIVEQRECAILVVKKLCHQSQSLTLAIENWGQKSFSLLLWLYHRQMHTKQNKCIVTAVYYEKVKNWNCQKNSAHYETFLGIFSISKQRAAKRESSKMLLGNSAAENFITDFQEEF